MLYCWYIWLKIIIVRERGISGTTAARGLKFWLQVALSAPIATAWKQNRKSGSGSGKTGFCPENFFRFFRFYGPLGTSGSLPGGSRTTYSGSGPGNPFFSKIRIFRFFDFLSLKTQQYGCLWTPLDQPKSPVPVLRYLTVLNGTFSVLFRYF